MPSVALFDKFLARLGAHQDTDGRIVVGKKHQVAIKILVVNQNPFLPSFKTKARAKFHHKLFKMLNYSLFQFRFLYNVLVAQSQKLIDVWCLDNIFEVGFFGS